MEIVQCALRRGNCRRCLSRKAVWLDPASGYVEHNDCVVSETLGPRMKYLGTESFA